MSWPFTVPKDISSARSSPQVGSLPAPPFQEAMQALTPFRPSKSGDDPVGKAAITFGGFVVRSNATTEELPLPTNRVLPSGVSCSPSGPESGFTPLARAAQHCAPGNPPKPPWAPNPGKKVENESKKPAFLQPNRVSTFVVPGAAALRTAPAPVMIEGMTESGSGFAAGT